MTSIKLRLPRYCITLVCIALAGAGAFAIKLFQPLPLAETAPVSRLVLDRRGEILRAFTTPDGYWRLDATSSALSKNYVTMLLAFEDRRFWRHPGVDPFALVRAVWQAVRYGRMVSGGSTLTMQVARLLRGSPTHSGWVKIQQIADAIRLEAAFDKPDILNLYLKLAPFGGNLQGVRAASLAYLGKDPQRLSVAEAALLVAIPQAPETRRLDRSDTASPGSEGLLTARNRVIRQAALRGAIKSADAAFAMRQPLPKVRNAFPALAAHLSDRLAADPQMPPGDIVTTIDKRLQQEAEAITRRRVQGLGDKLSIAALAVDHRTGEVLAHAGSPGYLDEARLGAIDMTAAVRSPGSALKPFIYGIAFEDGLAHPETLIEDRPVRFDGYAPVNFDKSWHGTVSVRQALQFSLNVPAVKVLNEIGPAKLSARFRDVNMPFTVPHNLTVALGGTGLTLEQLAELYAGLARGGTVVPLRYTKRAETVATTEPLVLLQPAAAWYVTDILRGVPTPSGQMPGTIAFKTGTSYGFRDAWAVGFDGDHTIAVWVGRADGSASPGLMGLKAAAPVVFELFAALGTPTAPFAPAPQNVLQAKKSTDLPPPLRVFHEQNRDSTTIVNLDQPPRIAYPLANSEVDLAGSGISSLALKAEGGTLPLTWLVNGAPIPSAAHRREAFLNTLKPGFVQLTVVDAAGRSDRAQVRLR